MKPVSLSRLYVLRGTYLFIVMGLGLTVWPAVLHHTPTWPLMSGVVCSLLAAVSLLAALGIRYPLQMLPLLLFELIWKSIWLISVALPLWAAGKMDARTLSTVFDCLLGIVLLPIVIPWGYVVLNYVKQRGDRWRSATAR
jgi:hypothetical protein